MPYKDPNKQREYMARYNARPDVKAAQAAAQAAYRTSPQGKAAKAAANARYAASPQGKAAVARYTASPEGKAAQAAASAKYHARPDVKAAQAARHVSLWYGLTLQEVERMFADQAGLCASCMDEISLVIGAENYRHIDHDHAKQKGEPGFIRGLLCKKCNTAIGMLEDSPERAQLAALYLGAHR